MNTAWFFLGSKPFQQISCHICIKYEYGCDTCSVRAFAIPYFPSMKWKMFNYLYCIKEDFVVLRFAVGESVFQFVFIAFDSRFRSVILLNICSSYCILYNKFSHEVCFNIFSTYFPKFDFKTFFFFIAVLSNICRINKCVQISGFVSNCENIVYKNRVWTKHFW